jgi:hypothetical protein
MRVLAPLIERIEADVMASDLLHADDTPIRVLDRSQREKGLGKGVKKGRIWPISATSAPGQAPRHPARSMPSRRTGRKNTFIAIWPTPAASCRPTATRTMPSSMIRTLTGGLARCPLKGTIGDAIFAVLCGCGHNIRKILARIRAILTVILAFWLATHCAKFHSTNLQITA